MAELSFETLSFTEEKELVKVNLLRQFYFYLEKIELERIGEFKLFRNRIVFPNVTQDKVEKKFGFLLEKGMKKLKNSVNDNKVVYVHQNSGIPLIGNVAFGLVYRNTSLIEIKPQTSCNLNCIYCSIGEGIHSDKNDFVVEKEYLVEEFRKLVKFVGEDEIEAHIGTHGEAFLYGDIINLVKDLNRLKEVNKISIDTNGTLLNEKIIEDLSRYEKVVLNISLNTLNPETAKTISGIKHYNLERILELIKFCKGKVKVFLTPLIVPSYNDQEIEELVKFAKENKLGVGIQNFLKYKTGRNPAKPWGWDTFYGLLKELSEKYAMKLVYGPEDFKIRYTKKLEKPFKTGDVVVGEIVCFDRFPGSKLAVVDGDWKKARMISLPNCKISVGKKVKIKIMRDKHNIFIGKLI